MRATVFFNLAILNKNSKNDHDRYNNTHIFQEKSVLLTVMLFIDRNAHECQNKQQDTFGLSSIAEQQTNTSLHTSTKDFWYDNNSMSNVPHTIKGIKVGEVGKQL